MSGKVEWIGVRPASKADVVPVDSVRASVEGGLEGDHRTQPHRQVTLISKEQMAAVATAMNTREIDPSLTRRNILISGLDFGLSNGQQIRLGSAVLEVTGPCPPCTRMDQNLGDGAREAMINLAGLTTRVTTSGDVQIGDSAELV